MARSLPVYQRHSEKATQTDMSFVETEPLRPQLFVTRQNGNMIPLVAVDELPSTVSIRGVPRTLSPHDISGMTGVGTFNSRHRQYVVDGLTRGFDHPLMTGGRSLMGSSFATSRPLRTDISWGTTSATLLPTPPKAYGIREQPPINTATPFANMAPSTPPPPSAATANCDLPPFHNLDELSVGRAPGIKEYCSYWLRHGECDYAQQGCLYRHEMPLDRPTLEKLGLRDIPRWYREKHRLGSYLAGGNTMNGINAAAATKPSFMERNWRSHLAEFSLEGTGGKPEMEDSSPSKPREQPDTKPDTSHPLPPPPPTASMPKPATPTHKPVTSTPKPTYHAILSRHQPSPTTPTKTKMTRNVSEDETISARQMRETIRMLDAYDERDRDRLSEKYQTLEPQKAGIAVPVNTPSTSTASSTSGGAETEDVAADVVSRATHSALSIRPPLPWNCSSACPRPATVRPTSAAKKRLGKAKRRGNSGREMGGVVDVRETVNLERLADLE